MGPGFDLLVVRDFAIALSIGALIGLEREKRKERDGDIGIAGIRTFMLFAQTGAVSAWLSRQQNNPWIFVVSLGAVALLTTAAYLAQTRTRPAAVGLTTEIAAVATCLLGGLVLFGFPGLAVPLAIVTSALLAYKQPLHELVSRIGTSDLHAGAKLLIATFVVLPLLPDRGIDPWGAINPYKLWWLVILISGLSLIGYVAVRSLGTGRGTILTGVTGGLVSSTAVTLAFSKRSTEAGSAGSAEIPALAAGVLVAWMIMFARVMVMVAVVFAPLLPRILAACGAMGAVALVAAVVCYRRGVQSRADRRAGPDVPLTNPFSLTSAVRFALLFAVVLLGVELARRYAPSGGLYLVAALAGLTDVDAITLSMASSARSGGGMSAAASAIVVAAISNTVVKAGLVSTLGSRELRFQVLLGTSAVLAAGVIALVLG